MKYSKRSCEKYVIIMSRFMVRMSLLVIAIGCTNAPENAQDNSNSQPVSEIGFVPDTIRYFRELEQRGFSGGLLIARDGETLLHEGFGLANRAAGRPWSKDTISTIGSITKQFTGAAILLLQEDGHLNVADEIRKYFADVPADKQSITLHQLLTHSSGITDLNGLGDWDPIERDIFIRRALQQPLAFDPGSAYEYSNAGYSLLGAIIEQTTGASYETFLRERVFLPLGMLDTGYIQAGWSSDRVAIGYRGKGAWGTVLERPMADDGPYWALRANGGVHSTTADMLRWAQALMQGKVLMQESLRAYWGKHVDEGYGDSYYGYGWVVMESPDDHRLITHNGGNGIFFADMGIYPDDDVIVVLQTNVSSDWSFTDEVLYHIAARLFEDEAYPGVNEDGAY